MFSFKETKILVKFVPNKIMIKKQINNNLHKIFKTIKMYLMNQHKNKQILIN